MSTNKTTPFLEEILHLIARFLRKMHFNDEAAMVEQHYTLPEWVENNNPLVKKGLSKIIKEYVRNNAKMLKYFESRTP